VARLIEQTAFAATPRKRLYEHPRGARPDINQLFVATCLAWGPKTFRRTGSS
jgi:hypothetical protein